jgi:hypothetical protein
MTYIDRDFDFIAYRPSTLPSLKTWTMTIGSILVAFGTAYWTHISFAPLPANLGLPQ